jgi:adenylate cyclase
MKAKLINLDANSIYSVEQIRSKSPGCFGFWVNASIGVDGSGGADDFQIFVCTQSWLKKEQSILPGKYLLIEDGLRLNAIVEELNKYLDNCDGDSWEAVVDKISAIGKWEFEGYDSSSTPQ